VARIIGGIGTSHVPTIGLAVDRGKQDDPDWAPLFAGYAPVAKWLAERRPDVLVYFYNDHATTFLFDHYPTFALGVGERFAIADEGLGPRPRDGRRHARRAARGFPQHPKRARCTMITNRRTE
jgi:Catalytic LigB subunit of aromatic ring-opening dioxygenase